MGALSILVHGDTKVGKSTLGNTAPGPRLLLDAEAAYRFLPGRKVFWDPHSEEPPTPGRGRRQPQADAEIVDYDWETCVVIIRDYGTLTRAYEWLNTGRHAFRSVVIDSISEIQKKLKDSIKSLDEEMNYKRWGLLLDHMEKLVRDFRDLTEHPIKPIEAVVLTAMTIHKDGKWRPYVQGSLATTMPYFLDVIGYLFVQSIADPNDPTAAPEKQRYLLIGKHDQFEAGERVQGRLPEMIANPNIAEMLACVFPTDEESN